MSCPALAPYSTLSVPALLAMFLASGTVRLSARELPDFASLPPPAECLIDRAGTLPESVRRAVAACCRELGEQGAVRIVWLDSLEAAGATPAAGWTAEAFGRGLLEHWRQAELRPGSEVSSGWDRAVLLVFSAADREVAAVGGPTFLARGAELRRVEDVFAYQLDRDDLDAAFAAGLSALDAFLRGAAVRRPGGGHAAVVFSVLFVLLLASWIDYLRKGPGCISYRMWRRLFSVLAAAVGFLLERTMDLGARSGSSEEGEGGSGAWATGTW